MLPLLLNCNKCLIKIKNKMKQLTMLIAFLIIVFGQACTETKEEEKKVDSKETKMETEQYTFPLSDKVTRKKVTFKNRFGITLTGDLYLPKNSSTNSNLPALAISGPFGAVKEQ